MTVLIRMIILAAGYENWLDSNAPLIGHTVLHILASLTVFPELPKIYRKLGGSCLELRRHLKIGRRG